MNRLRKTWNPLIVVPILGMLSAYFFGLTSKQWAVTGEFTRWGNDHRDVHRNVCFSLDFK